MNKSQRIRDIFESKLAELRNPTLTGRQRIGKEHLMKGKKAVQDAIKSGKKTGHPFSKSQLSDIAQQHTDGPEIEAEEQGGGAKLPQHMRSSTPRAIATKKALLGDIKSRRQAQEDTFKGQVAAEIKRGKQPQNSSTNYARAGLRALFETVLDEADIYQKSARVPSHINPVKASSVLIKKMSKSRIPGMSQQDADKAARKGIAQSNSRKTLKGMAARRINTDPYDTDQIRHEMHYESKTERDPFGKPDPNDPKDFGIEPLPKAPRIKFKPKRAKMPKGPIAVTKKPFQRDPLDP